jgi:hypothetical protein
MENSTWIIIAVKISVVTKTYKVRVSSGEGDGVSCLHFLAHEVDVSSDSDQFAFSPAQVYQVEFQGVCCELHLRK